ncbi:hypothetical protein C5167_041376 [Papaver somniferum]|nr:hypothetical protein C5167_041376 [Papaver somniferum]
MVVKQKILVLRSHLSLNLKKFTTEKRNYTDLIKILKHKHTEKVGLVMRQFKICANHLENSAAV